MAPDENYFGPPTPRGLCPLCLAPETNGGMRAGSYIPFECGTSAKPTGNDTSGNVYYRDIHNFSLGKECRRNIIVFREYFYEGKTP